MTELKTKYFIELVSLPIYVHKNELEKLKLFSLIEKKLNPNQIVAVVKERDAHFKNAYDILNYMKNYAWYIPDISARDAIQVAISGASTAIATRSPHAGLVATITMAINTLAMNWYDRYENLTHMNEQFAYEYNMYLMCCEILERNALP